MKDSLKKVFVERFKSFSANQSECRVTLGKLPKQRDFICLYFRYAVLARKQIT
jgi:hypothetical protein